MEDGGNSDRGGCGGGGGDGTSDTGFSSGKTKSPSAKPIAASSGTREGFVALHSHPLLANGVPHAKHVSSLLYTMRNV